MVNNMKRQITLVTPDEAYEINQIVTEWEKNRPNNIELPKFQNPGADVVRLAVAEFIANQNYKTFFEKTADRILP